MTDHWVVVPNWDRFQHYRDRDPRWIKLHRSLASDPDWWDLSGHRRAVLVGIWLEYATTNRRLPDDTSTLSRRIGVRVTRPDVEALVAAGFIQISASKPLAPSYQDASPEKTRTETPISPFGKPKKQARNGRVVCPDCGVQLAGPKALADHVENVHW